MDGKGDGESANEEDERHIGLTPQVLDYYKRFGRHRDLEQYFSLSTVQGEVRDPVFWRSIKSQPDSDSSKSSAEVCRISINCTVADPSSSSQDGSVSERQEPNSPPIISADVVAPALTLLLEDDKEPKSDLDNSRKSADLNLDNSLIKPHSPTSSINSQRKLEWDSLADVGYANENEKKLGSTSLSTMERLALHQQFSLSDELKNDDISGHPTAHSTPHDVDDVKSKAKKNGKKSLIKHATKVSQREVDVMEVNVDRSGNNVVPANINVSLTKHISFNVDPETGAASVCTNKTIQKIAEVVNESEDAAVGAGQPLDKEIQTTLPRHHSEQRQNNNPSQTPNIFERCIATVPVLLNLDLLKQSRYRGLRYYRNKVKKRKKKLATKPQLTSRKKMAEILEKSIPVSEVTMGGSQVSEADSFEYMPAHVYHQNTARNNSGIHEAKPETSIKTSSSASSGGYTTQSSKHSEHSFTKDLERSIALLNKLVQLRHQDSHLKKKLIKEIVQKLINTNYRDDDSTTEFLSGLSFNSKILGLGIGNSSCQNTTTSTSDGNSGDAFKHSRPKKSILRSPKFDKPVNPLVSSEHIVGETLAQIHSPQDNLPITINSASTESNTELVDNTGKKKTDSENEFPMTSSEHLYELYLNALKNEEKYKEHLKSKQESVRQKLLQNKHHVSTSWKSSSLKDLFKDLTKNNVCKAGGDGDILPDPVHSSPDSDRNGTARKLRSHSVFTISSGNSDRKVNEPGCSKQKKTNDQTSAQSVKNKKESTPIKNCNLKFGWKTLPRSNSSSHYCCCPHHDLKGNKADPPLQINKRSNSTVRKLSAIYSGQSKDFKASENTYSSSKPVEKQDTATNAGDELTTDLVTCNKFVCFCNADGKIVDDIPDEFFIYKCRRLPHSMSVSSYKGKNSISVQCSSKDFNSGFAQNTPVTEKEKQHFIEDTGHSDSIQPVSNFQFDSDPSPGLCKFRVASMENNVPAFIPKKNYIPRKLSKLSEPSTSDLIQHIISRTNKDSLSSSEQSDSRIHSVTQSASINQDIHRRFSDTHAKQPKSTLCVDTYMQTSVSINPKISEPTLADIDVLHEGDGRITNERSATIYNAECTLGPGFFTRDSDKACTLMETQARIILDKPIAIQNNKQAETNKILDAILHLEGSSEKSRVSSVQSYNEDLFSYLNDEKSEDSDLNIPKMSDEIHSDFVNQQNDLCKKDIETSMTDLVRENLPIQKIHNCKKDCSSQKVPINLEDAKIQIKAKSIPSGVHPYEATMNSSKHRGVSTQVTPREKKLILSCQDNVTTQNSDRSVGSTKKIPEPKHDEITSSMELINKRNKSVLSRVREKGQHSNNECIDKKSVSVESKSTEDNSRSSSLSKEVLMETIKDIIKRYAKDDKPLIVDKRKSRQKYYKEIISKLNYLLQTDGKAETDDITSVKSTNSDEEFRRNTSVKDCAVDATKKDAVDKCTQLRNGSSHCKLPRESIVYSCSRPHTNNVIISEDSSDMPHSSDIPQHSSDYFTCQMIKKIKRECEKFHQKHCQCSKYFEKLTNRYDASSSTSVNHTKDDGKHATCRTCHRGRHKSAKSQHGKMSKKSIAYNLIIEPSESFIPDENVPERDTTQLKDVVVKIPSRRTYVPDKPSQCCDRNKTESEMQSEKPVSHSQRRDKNSEQNENKKSEKTRMQDDSEMSGTSEVRKFKFLTVREYLERNRPDFVHSAIERQNCLKVIHESRARQQRVQRQLLSLQVERGSDVSAGCVSELESLARRFGEELRNRRPNAKFLSEREMKQHSRKIYKSLPEVIQKKEKHKKDQIKKTNLLISSLFNKNLQKKALRGSVNISHYSPVIKI